MSSARATTLEVLPPSAWIEVPHFDWGALADARAVRFAKNQTLFSQDGPSDRIFLLEEGRVRLVLISATGFEKHLAIVGTRGLVGESSVCLDGRHSFTAIASSDVVARQLDRRQLLAAMDADPVCLRQVMWLVGTKLRIVAHQNLMLAEASAACRVISHLLQLAQTYGEPAGAAVHIRIAFTHQELANISGLSRVMTSTVLAQLHDDQLIGRAGSTYVIRDLAALRRRMVEA